MTHKYLVDLTEEERGYRLSLIKKGKPAGWTLDASLGGSLDRVDFPRYGRPRSQKNDLKPWQRKETCGVFRASVPLI
jgi:hypothetical protein